LTGLYRSAYGLADVAVAHAVPRSCALLRENAAFYRMLEEFSQIAEALGKVRDAGRYKVLGERIRQGINAHLWDERRGYYRIKIFRNPTTDKNSPLYGITEDDRFLVNGNMVMLYCGVPDSEGKTRRLIEEIERIEGDLEVYGREVVPPYPKGWMGELFEKGHYFINSMYANWYAVALFRLGYPDEGLKVLTEQAEVVCGDGAFYECYGEGSVPRGAHPHSFSAASFIGGLVGGLFGLDADYPGRVVYIRRSLRRSWRIVCRLGMHKFELTVDAGASARLTVDTAYSGRAEFRVLIPDRATSCRVVKDGTSEVPCHIRTLGKATYALFACDLKPGPNTFDLTCGRG